MMMIEKLGLKALHCLAPETAHNLSLRALRMGLVPLSGRITSPRLRCNLAGMALDNPIGLAAGFDKNAVAIPALARAGFGFLEVGAVTPLAQPGNPQPRFFRLPQDRAVINRFGFNNNGMEAAARRLAFWPFEIPVGLNLGANKTSPDRSADYAHVLAHCGKYVDFVTVNVSSPNTENLRDLQGAAALAALLDQVMETREKLARPIPVFLKIAPDLNAEDLASIGEIALGARLDAIIATNTTLDRHGLKSSASHERGGLSGAPLFEKSTRVLAQLYAQTRGRIPLIGVGGIASAEDAYTKIKAGASAVQLYTALGYHGLGLVKEIAQGLEQRLENDGFENVSLATGRDYAHWL